MLIRRKTILLSTIVALILLVSSIVSADSFVLTILHTADVHGRIFAFDDLDLGPDVGGFARQSTLVNQIRSQNPHTLLLGAGDLFSGTPVSALFQGEAELIASLLLGYDALVIGNHEFDYGHEVLKDYVDYLPIPLLGANIIYSDGTSFAPGYTYFDVGGVRVLVIGVVTTSTYRSTHPRNVVGLDFLDPARTIEKIMEEQSGTYDVLIVLSHLGITEDLALAEKVQGIDVIIGGHTNTLLTKPLFVGDTLIAHAGEWGKYLGQVDLTIEAGRVVNATSRVIPIDAHVVANPVVESILTGLYMDKIEAAMARVVGHSPIDLLRSALLDPKDPHRDTELGNFVTDALLWDTGADFALYNSSGLRADVLAGDVTVGDLYTVEPFGNFVVTVEIDKDQLIQLFHHMAARGGEQISGATYAISDGKPQDILIGGEPVTDRTYTVATIDFLTAGGSGYVMLAEGRDLRVYDTVRDTLIRFLEAHPDYVFQREGRVVVR